VSLEPKVIWCTSLRILHACRSKISSIVSTALFKRQHPCIAPLSPNFTSPVTMSSVRSESGHIPFVFLGAWPALHPSRSRCPTTTAPPQRMESDAVVVVGHEKESTRRERRAVHHKHAHTHSTPRQAQSTPTHWAGGFYRIYIRQYREVPHLRNAGFGASQLRFLLEQQNKPASLWKSALVSYLALLCGTKCSPQPPFCVS
jgi:hypothetical protein